MTLSRPNAIGVAFPKAGTSFIARVLTAHPKVCFPHPDGMPRKAATTNLLASPEVDENRLAQYIGSNFPTFDPLLHSIMMEWRTSYIYSEDTLRTIGRLLGDDVRIVLAYRNPVDAFFSMYNYMITLNPDDPATRRSPAWFLDNDFDNYVSPFFYDEHFERLRDVLPQAPVILLRYETLQRAPDILFAALYDFLEIPHIDAHRLQRPANQSRPYRNVFYDKCIRKALTVALGEARATRLYKAPDEEMPAILRALLALNRRNIKADPKIVKKLQDIHASHVARFEKLTINELLV